MISVNIYNRFKKVENIKIEKRPAEKAEVKVVKPKPAPVEDCPTIIQSEPVAAVTPVAVAPVEVITPAEPAPAEPSEPAYSKKKKGN